MHFCFDVHCFIFTLSARRGISLICIGNVHTNLSRTAFLKRQWSWCYMLSTVSNTLYLTHIVYLYFQRKAQIQISVLPLWKWQGFIHVSPIKKMSWVLLSCTFCVSAVFITETVFVVISCQGWLGLYISSDGQEAVWFFFYTVIRSPPPPSLPCKCDAKHLKVLSPMIKDSSLSVASLCLI